MGKSLKSTVLEIFNNMTDDTLEYMSDPSELKQLCNALSLDLQLLEESNTDYIC